MFHSRGTRRPICNLSRIVATRQLDAFTVPSTHYVSNNCICVRSRRFAGTNPIAIDLMTMKDWLFSQHRPPAPRHQQSCHFFVLWMTVIGEWLRAFHVLRKICRIKTSLQFISAVGHNTTLPSEYLGLIAVFQWNINLREAARTSSPNVLFTPNSFAVRSPKFCGTGWNCVRTEWRLWQLFRVFLRT